MLSKEVYKFVAEQLKPYSADGRVHGGNSMVLSTGGKRVVYFRVGEILC